VPEHAAMQRVVWLIHRHLKEDITEEEKRELSKWMEAPGSEGLFSQVTSDLWLEKELPSYYEFEKQSGEDWKGISEKLFRRNIYARVRAISPWIRYLAAACIFIGVLVAAYTLFIASPSQVPLPVLTDNRQILPSKPSATLLLTDGTIIQMENERSGVVTKQGPIKVVKKKGQLVYLRKNSVADSSMPAYRPDQAFPSGPLLDTPGTTKKTEELATQLENNVTIVPWNTLKVAAGGQFTITLPDGSRIWLNSESTLRYPVQFTGPERRVYLSGEAYFEVFSNSGQPFIVSVHRDNDSVGTEFQAVGTKFNIRAYDDEPGIVTTVVEGQVKALKEGQYYMIPVHGQFQWKDSSYVVVKGVKDRAVISWKEDYFDLDGATIGEIMNIVKRWYGIEVILKTDNKRLFLGKLPKSVPLSDLLELLKINGYQIIISDNTLTISDN
jgi:transmembrane sensor